MEYNMFRNYLMFEDVHNERRRLSSEELTSRPVLGRHPNHVDFPAKITDNRAKMMKFKKTESTAHFDINGNLDSVFHEDAPGERTLVDSNYLTTVGSEMTSPHSGNLHKTDRCFRNSSSSDESLYAHSEKDETWSVKSFGWSNQEDLDFTTQNVGPYGSTGFYKNIDSDYGSSEPVSPVLATSPRFNIHDHKPERYRPSSNHWNGRPEKVDHPMDGSSIKLQNGNVEQITLEMLQTLPINGESGGYDGRRWYRKTLDAEKHCAFCKRNGETREYYSTHIVRDSRDRVICPILRRYSCPICRATGDQAHTKRHCPFRLKSPLQSDC